MKEALQRIRYASARTLRRAANIIYPKPWGEPTNAVYGLGKEYLPKDAKKALIIYNIAAIRYLAEGRLEAFPKFFKHTMYWESVEMVRLLNKHGYIVDYFDNRNPSGIAWENYDLVIDEGNNLKDAPTIADQHRIYYATGCHWLFHNQAEMKRISDFQDRHGILIPANRQLPSIMSDNYAHTMTYLGTEFQARQFNSYLNKIPLNISSVIAPPYQKKDLRMSRNRFLWIGGGGLIHKGLDLVIEAFAKLPQAELFIAGNIDDETRFAQWARSYTSSHTNIHLLGWIDVQSVAFAELANTCIASVYASCAEGGGGSVVQALHFGLIPILTPASTVRAEYLGYSITGDSGFEMIDSIRAHVQHIIGSSDIKLHGQSEAVYSFAREHHTRDAYRQSFEKLLKHI